jgi:hypothetical protein
LEGSENHLDYPLSEFGDLSVGMSDWKVGWGSKGDSGVLTARVVATLTALGAFTSASSSFSSLSATPTPTRSGDESLKGY